jgi:basic membrane protein A and related proteins
LSVRKWMPWLAVAFVAALALAVTAVGAAKPAASAAPAKAAATPIKVALVTDIGGLDDRSFNFLANKGLQRAKATLGAQGRVYISKANSDYIPNLSTAARQKYDLVIAVGFLMADSVAAVAKRYPTTKFAIIDYPAAILKGKPKNVRGLLFAEQEAGYLAGVAAATVSKSGVIGSVGGQKIAPVDAYIAGYQYGAKKTKPGIKTLNGYSQEFVAQDKCKELALNQLAQKADVVFQVAGQCGLGAMSAAKDRGGGGIGVDADQGYIGTHVLTSAMKRVDTAVFAVSTLVKAGKFKGGVDTLFNIKNNGVGYGKISAKAPKTLKAKLDAVVLQMKAGKIKNIPRTVK